MRHDAGRRSLRRWDRRMNTGLTRRLTRRQQILVGAGVGAVTLAVFAILLVTDQPLAAVIAYSVGLVIMLAVT